MERKVRLNEIAAVFLKLGFIGFGGPAVHIAMMQNEVVVKKKWISEQQFLDLIGATNLIPGPNSTEMALHIGHEKRGWKGLLISGFSFILPAVFITSIFAWLYKAYGQLPEVEPYLYGIKPAIIAVILSAIVPLAKKSIKSLQLAFIGILVLIGSLLNFYEIYLLFGAGLVALFFNFIPNQKMISSVSLLPILFLKQDLTNSLSITNVHLFLIFLKIGAILYGSGYVLFAFLDTELVSTGILTRQQLIDAIAIGQFTPGPVFSAVTFIGYQINDWTGAILATVAIFIPSFLFVAFLNPLVKVMRNSKWFSVFLDAVNVASVAIIVAVCMTMAHSSVSDWKTLFIGLLSLTLAFKFRKINSIFLILGGSIVGFLLSLI